MLAAPSAASDILRPVLRPVSALLLLLLCAGPAPGWVKPKKHPTTDFGAATRIPYSLRGEIYLLPEGASRLPVFDGKGIGAVYTTALNVPKRSFMAGFPGVTTRFEWFAIDYKGEFYVRVPGKYHFILTSDDGSILYVDDKVVIDNDGTHASQTLTGAAQLTAGPHQLRLAYFQGPRYEVALELWIAPPQQKYRIFDTHDFLPPEADHPVLSADDRPTLKH